MVGIAGAVLGFAANAVSPRGLALARNYFPGGTNGLIAAVTLAAPTHPADSTTTPAGPAPLSEVQTNEKGLQLIGSNRVDRLFTESRTHPDKVVFVDARDEDEFRLGHVPGAWEFNPYKPEKRIAQVLPVCQAASNVVVYCTGGDCEDSQFAAVLLRDAGVPNSNLFVYTGGITEWNSNSMPVESGDHPAPAASQSP